MTKKVKVAVAIIVIAVIVGAVAIVGMLIKNRIDNPRPEVKFEDLIDKNADVEHDSVYSMDMAIYSSDYIMTMFLHTEDDSFSYFLGTDKVMEGTYKVEGNLLTTTTTAVAEQNDDGTTSMVDVSDRDNIDTRYIIDGEYLLMEGGLYQGAIPAGDTFEAEIYHTDSTGSKISYTFAADGTYKCKQIPSDEREGSVEEYNMDGTYTRNGNLIERTLSGNEMLPFYVYKDHLFVSYLTAGEAESMKDVQ